MDAMRRSWRRRWTVLLVGAALAAVAVGCTRVGTGQLYVRNDLSGLGRDNTVLDAFVADAGDAWPPAGQLSLWVRGDDFGNPPSYGMNGYLYLVRTDDACPETEAGPQLFELADVTIVGVVTVRGGSVDQFVTMADAAVHRQPRWALIEIGPLPGFGAGTRSTAAAR